ncbi:MAG: methyltransferase domain-containing protein [Desulfobacteraceae bacterium]|nr:methyltransferase domain-containing protein [Desulfobacteraceae bacterium]
MNKISERVANLSPEKRKLLEKLLQEEGFKMPPSQIESQDNESALIDLANFDMNFEAVPSSDDIKKNTKRFYNAVTQQLDSTTFGKYARFLNYGYTADTSPQYAVIESPEHSLNRNSVKLILELVGNCNLINCRILDVGCGRGGNVEVMAKYFDASGIIGMDLSPNAISFCEANNEYSHVLFLTGDAENLPFGNVKFDVVTNIESSHSYPDIFTFYTEVCRVLKKGGYFLYTDLLPTELIDSYLSYLQNIGFTLEQDRDITNNVLLSCDETASMHMEAFKSENNPELMRDFLALPGSEPYEEMKKRTSLYKIFRLRKEVFRKNVSRSISEDYSRRMPLREEYFGSGKERRLPTPQSDFTGESSVKSETPMVCIQTYGEKLPLFLIHPVSGNVFCYIDLSRQLGADQPLYGLKAFGLDSGTSALTRVEDMAVKYIKAIRSVYPEGPYILGGLSGGGNIGYEMAQQLRQQGEEVSLLILIDTFGSYAMFNIGNDSEHFMEFCISVGEFFGFDFFVIYSEIRGLDSNLETNEVRRDIQGLTSQKRLYVLQECIIRAEITNSDISIEYLERTFKVYVENFRAIFNYVHRPYSGKIILFRATDDPLDLQMGDPARLQLDETLGWNRYASDIEVYDIPGSNHYTILTPPYVSMVAKKLKQILGQCDNTNQKNQIFTSDEKTDRDRKLKVKNQKPKLEGRTL